VWAPSCTPQIVILNENAVFQSVINEVISAIIMIWMTCFRGAGSNGYMVEILWHHRETRWQTEKHTSTGNMGMYVILKEEGGRELWQK
jgi:hypothetical protein